MLPRFLQCGNQIPMRAAAALIALSLLLALPATPQDLRAGRAAIKITPPAGIPMAGYYNTRLAEGTHDDLWAKALVLESRSTRIALVACDLVNIPADLSAAARKLAESATGIPASHIILSATHSHTGPLLGGRSTQYVEGPARKVMNDYRSSLPAKIASAVRAAAAALAPARLSTATGHEESVSFYRRFLMKDGTVRTNPGKRNPQIVQPMGQIDPEVQLVWIESAAAKPLLAYVNHALHLDTVGGLQFSADFPYTLSAILSKLYGPDLVTLFTNGAAGNINHINVATAAPQKGHAEARRIGTILAGEVLKTIARLQPVAAGPLTARSEIVPLPLPAYTPEQIAHARVTAARFGKPGSPGTVPLAEAFRILDVADRKGAPLEAEVQVVALGKSIAWVGLPGEIFVELGQAIKKASPFPTTIIVELSNGQIGYVPTRKAFEEGGYEVLSARFAPGGGELLAETAIKLLSAIHRVPEQ